MKLPSNVRFVDKELKESFESLECGKGENKELYRWLVNSFEAIEENAFCGIQIPKKQIPKT